MKRHWGTFFLFTALVLSTTTRAQNAALLISTGDSLLAQGKPQRALQQYQEAVRIDPSADNHVACAKAWYALERMDHFIQEVDRALYLDSANAEAHYQKALYAMRASDRNKAIEHAGKAIEYGRNSALVDRAYILRGEARAELRQLKPAIDDLQRGLSGTSADTEAMSTLAQLLDADKRHEESLEILIRLCELEPTVSGHWTNRGYELAMLGRHEEAMGMYERALSMDKDEPVTLSDRAASLLALGREKEAWNDVEKSLKSYPSNPHALLTRGQLYLRKGELEKACEDLSMAKLLGDLPIAAQLMSEHCAGMKRKR